MELFGSHVEVWKGFSRLLVINCGPWFTETTNHLCTMRTKAGALEGVGSQSAQQEGQGPG